MNIDIASPLPPPPTPSTPPPPAVARTRMASHQNAHPDVAYATKTSPAYVKVPQRGPPSSARRYVRLIALEASFFLHNVIDTLLEFANTNLYLQKACRANATAEPDLSTPCDQLEDGLTFVANANAYVMSVKMFTVLSLVALYSSWSDVAGRQRKPFIVLPMASLALQAAFGHLSAYAWTLHPTVTVLTSAGLQMTFGNLATIYTFALMYLSDVVEPRDRTMRLGILTAIRVAGQLVGKGTSGYLLRCAGFAAYYASCTAASLAAALFAYAYVDDISVPVAPKPSLRAAFNVRRLVRSCKIILSDGNGRRRRRLVTILLLLLHPILMFVHEGQYTVMYLYLRYKFDWDEIKYSIFLFYGCVGSIIGSLFSSVVLSKLLTIHDGVIGIVASIWDACIAASYLFAFQDWHLFLISGMDIFFGVSSSVCSSFITKFYDTSEMGHLFAVKVLFSLLIPFCHPAYNILFTWTLHDFPHAFFYISVVLYLLGAVLYGIIYRLNRQPIKSNINNTSAYAHRLKSTE